MDRNLCRQIAPLMPSLEAIDAEARAAFPDDPLRANAYAYGRVAGCYHSARVMVLMGAEPEEEDEEETHEHGEPVGVKRALPVDDEAVDYGTMPTVEERIMSTPTGRMRA